MVGKLQRLHELFAELFTRMDLRKVAMRHVHLLMVVDNLDLVSTAIFPDEADAPSIIDPDTVQSCLISFQ